MSLPPPVPLARSVSDKATAYAAIALALVGVAFATRQPQYVALAAPFAVAVLLGLALARPPAVSLSVHASRDRVLEGEDIELTVVVRSDIAIGRLEVILPTGQELSYGEAVPHPFALAVPADRPVAITLPATARQWGVLAIGGGVLRVRGPLGLTTFEGGCAPTGAVKVFPDEDTLRHLARPTQTTLVAGELTSAVKAEGFDYADVRAYRGGDPVRTVNWRATARAGELRVNDRHPERSTDVVLLLDSFSPLALPAAVRACVSMARAYLGQRDRVGVISLGGELRWLTLGLGERQLYRIVEALIESAATYSYAWQLLDRVPRKALPPNALLIAVSPLTDRRSIAAVLDRATSGAQTAVVHVSLEPYVPAGETDASRLGYLLWHHEVGRLADRLRSRGVAVVEWREGSALDAVLEEVAAFQRFARHRAG